MAEVVKVIADREPVKRRDGIAARVPDHLALLKPRVMSLVVFTGGVGMAAGAGAYRFSLMRQRRLFAWPPGAGGCGALNMWYDADIDGIMQRTAGRPIPTNRVAAREALITGILLSVLSVVTLGAAGQFRCRGISGLTIAIYVPFYTMFLKRRTAQNIVLGGAAGALPPVIGWAAVTGSAGLGALIAIPHHLSLDAAAFLGARDLPLLRLRAGEHSNASGGRWARKRPPARYPSTLSCLLWLRSCRSLLGLGGIVYTALAAVLGAVFLFRAFAIQREHETERRNKAAYKLFGFSIFYMFALFVALLATAL